MRTRGSGWACGLVDQTGFAQASAQIAADVLERLAHERGTRDQHEVRRAAEIMLLQAKGLPEQASRPAAHHRAAELAARDDCQARMLAPGWFPVEDQTPADATFALGPDAGKGAGATEALPTTQSQWTRLGQGRALTPV